MSPLKEPHTDDLLTATEVCRQLKISRSTFRRLREQGRLPQPILEASRTTIRWRRGDILQAIIPPPAATTSRGQILAASTHIRAAAMSARNAATHADAAASCLRQLVLSQANAIAQEPPA